jgi:hypothetical protein
MEHHDVICPGISADECGDKRLQKWTKQDLIKLEEATEVYMVEVIAESYS